MARLLTIVLFFSISANAVTVNQFQRELDLADKTILWALISASTQEGRKACSLSYFSCKAAEAELGLAYMAANDNKAFLTSLSRIMTFRILYMLFIKQGKDHKTISEESKSTPTCR